MASDIGPLKLNPASVVGEKLDVYGTNGVTVDGATVTKADMGCDNGAIQVIDTVLLPRG